MASSTFEQVKSDAKQGGLGMVGKKYETLEIIGFRKKLVLAAEIVKLVILAIGRKKFISDGHCCNMFCHFQT